MNPYSQLGVDQQTSGYLSQAGIDPTSTFQQAPQAQTGSQLSSYPTFPNAAGVGSQTAGAPQATPQTPVGAATTTPDASSRGMSPYSLLGDANYRQR